MRYLLLGTSALLIGCASRQTPPAKPAALSIPAIPERAPLDAVESKMSGDLAQLARTFKSSGLKSAAASAPMAVKEDAVEVDITAAKDSDLPALTQAVTKAGGKIRVTHGAHLYAFLPIAALRDLAALDMVWSLATPAKITSPQGK